MHPSEYGQLISVTGVWVQIGGTALLLPLFFLLTRRTGVRPFARRWAWAWLAMQAALLLVALRYLVAPALFLNDAVVHGSWLVLLHGAYLFAKLSHFVLLLAGVWLFCRGNEEVNLPLFWFAGAVVTSALAAVGTIDLNPVLGVQEPLAMLYYALCAALLFQLPAARRTPGTRFTGWVFVCLMILWTVYAAAYWAGLSQLSWVNPALLLITRYNSFFDTAGSLLLAFGMVVILLEDAWSENEAIRLDRLRAVAESEERLKAVLETATDAIVAADAAGRVALFNAGAERTFGRQREATIGRPLAELFVPAAAVEVGHRLDLVRRAAPAQPSLFEVTGLHTTGYRIPLEVAASAQPMADGALDILILRDLTERRRSEADRAQLQARLAQSARTESLGRLVSGVAHELNNPLAAILTYSEQLLTEAPRGDTAGPLVTIRDQARRARAIVRDLLTFVRRREERREAAEFGELLDRTIRALTADLERQSVHLELEIAPDLPTVQCDATAIEQVITNLIDNAARATPGGRVRVTVQPVEDRIRFVVEDDGPGIPTEHLRRIFEPFFTTRGTGEGTGLGLSVSLGIMQQHGGTLEAENLPSGRGARFVASLPVHSTGEARDRIPQRVTPAAGLAAGGRVVIIDDEAPVRDSLRRYFERQGWQVDEAADGSAGLALLLAADAGPSLDLILCDLKMPGLSGREVYQRLREARPELLTRLVFASGDTASPDTAAFLSLSGRPVLEKPFELRELVAVIGRLRGRMPLVG